MSPLQTVLRSARCRRVGEVGIAFDNDWRDMSCDRVVWNQKDSWKTGACVSDGWVDWCKADFVVLPWIDEFYSVVSNCLFVGLTAWPLAKSRQHRLPSRLVLLAFLQVLVGIGSAFATQPSPGRAPRWTKSRWPSWLPVLAPLCVALSDRAALRRPLPLPPLPYVVAQPSPSIRIRHVRRS